MSQTFSGKRCLAYMAGRSTPLFLKLLETLLSKEECPIAHVDFVVGDLVSYKQAVATKQDERIQLHYQHEHLNPWASSGPDAGKLADFEARFGAPHLRRYVLSQRIIDRLPEAKKWAYVQAYLEYYEQLWERFQPEILITGGADSLPFFMIQEVFKRKGTRLLALIPSRIVGRFHVVDNELEQVPGLEETYQSMLDQPLDEAGEALATQVRQAYVQKRTRPSYFGLGSRIKTLPSPTKFFKTQQRRKAEQDWFFDAPMMNHIINGLRVRFKTPLQRLSMKRLSQDLPVERFFYYPLHFEPEFSIDLLGTHLRDQATLIKRISAALPAQTVLCLKEHPNMSPGSRMLGFYKEMCALGNVRLLHSTIDGYDIIERCSGIVTISGTTGFEALFYNKPVLVLGRAFYDMCAGVRRATSHAEIAQALLDMLHGDPFDPADLDRFVVALYQNSALGAYEYTIDDIESDENVGHLATGVLHALGVPVTQEVVHA